MTGERMTQTLPDWDSRPDPFSRAAPPPEERIRIHQMGMGKLRSYMCAKSRGNPNVCQTCAGIDSCSAGKRAVELIAESEARAAPVNTAKEREEFRAACESGSAWGWLEKQKGISRGAAKELLISLISKYPDIGLEFGGKKQLLQRYRPWNAPEATQDEPEAASAPPDEETASPRENAPKSPEKAREHGAILGAARSAENRTQRAREMCTAALKSGDFIGYMMAQGKTREQALQNRNNWKSRHPDWFDGYPPEVAGYVKTVKNADTTSEPPPEIRAEEKTEEDTMTAMDDDVVGLEDFLAEYAPEPEKTAEAPQPPVQLQMPSTGPEETRGAEAPGKRLPGGGKGRADAADPGGGGKNQMDRRAEGRHFQGGFPHGKYGNRKTRVFGITFDSAHEAERYLQLKALEQAGRITDLQTQVSFPLLPAQKGPDGKVAERAVSYVADFVYQTEDGLQVVEDAKGYRTEVYKIKKKMMLYFHGIRIREV